MNLFATLYNQLLLMGPICVEVYLVLYFLFYSENLNLLRPLQDLPVFLKISERFMMSEKKMLNDEKVVDECCNFTEKTAFFSFSPKKAENERKI